VDLKTDLRFTERGIKPEVEETVPCIQDALEHDLEILSLGNYSQTLQIIYGESPWHRIFGHPQRIQNSIEAECELTLKRTNPVWILLLQLDSDEELGMCWGDVGRLYFMIDRADLRSKKFDEVLLILQCT
jgi:Domain of unknown function (DUF1963)